MKLLKLLLTLLLLTSWSNYARSVEKSIVIRERQVGTIQKLSRQITKSEVDATLYYNRFRYYDPSTGLYLSQDPIGLEGNNPTMYGYVHDSNSWVDIFGLIEVFRLLRPDEDPTKGLNAKKPGRGMSTHGHVSSGSRNKGSQFISTSTDPSALEKWREPGQRMVSFDTDDVVPDVKGNKNIFDISTVEKAKANGVGGLSAKFSASSKEVLVEGHVPANKIKCH
ncbi:RHS repeat-associated core domain-containing protein [Flavobacterium oreochromis]|uniref:RHS repeat-associated core domain-containing protein n=1 Tax=Flavobacterium oreochromis TaxID=2906078 RepID=UPI001CE5B6A4|nr:RHS repeat-associated core domain-containing protein [Flavobacterium oreochromis]QYS87252.1 RHS repeat-associated core domain-containing protein [Flavobacterium oreochromis]